MYKIFINITIILSCLFADRLKAQTVEISKLNNKINSKSSEFNFFKLNDSVAFFTSSYLNKKLQTDIYTIKHKDGYWVKRRLFYSLDEFSVANITYFNDEEFFISICGEENCSIAVLNTRLNSIKILDEPINIKGYTSTQPFITNKNGVQSMYFVSNRKGGYGGLDIWVSTINSNGTYGGPVNLGQKINSYADEISPFYFENKKQLYFSSNKKNGLGGFDIYTSKGNLNKWETKKNVFKLNSKRDDMYLNFHDSISGYFSSNRIENKFEDSVCCPSIYKFKYVIDERIDSSVININKMLPLTLYFDNDEPDCCTMDTITKLSYKDSYVSYFDKREDYVKKNNQSESFFNDSLKGNYNNLSEVFDMLYKSLVNGNRIELLIKGYSSPLYSNDYNKNLSKRRTVSLVNFLKQYKNMRFVQFLRNQQLIIKQISYGESLSKSEVSDSPREKNKSIYSIEAILSRKIQIVQAKIKNK